MLSINTNPQPCSGQQILSPSSVNCLPYCLSVANSPYGNLAQQSPASMPPQPTNYFTQPAPVHEKLVLYSPPMTTSNSNINLQPSPGNKNFMPNFSCLDQNQSSANVYSGNGYSHNFGASPNGRQFFGTSNLTSADNSNCLENFYSHDQQQQQQQQQQQPQQRVNNVYSARFSSPVSYPDESYYTNSFYSNGVGRGVMLNGANSKSDTFSRGYSVGMNCNMRYYDESLYHASPSQSGSGVTSAGQTTTNSFMHSLFGNQSRESSSTNSLPYTNLSYVETDSCPVTSTTNFESPTNNSNNLNCSLDSKTSNAGSRKKNIASIHSATGRKNRRRQTIASSSQSSKITISTSDTNSSKNSTFKNNFKDSPDACSDFEVSSGPFVQSSVSKQADRRKRNRESAQRCRARKNATLENLSQHKDRVQRRLERKLSSLFRLLRRHLLLVLALSENEGGVCSIKSKNGFSQFANSSLLASVRRFLGQTNEHATESIRSSQFHDTQNSLTKFVQLLSLIDRAVNSTSGMSLNSPAQINGNRNDSLFGIQHITSMYPQHNISEFQHSNQFNFVQQINQINSFSSESVNGISLSNITNGSSTGTSPAASNGSSSFVSSSGSSNSGNASSFGKSGGDSFTIPHPANYSIQTANPTEFKPEILN